LPWDRFHTISRERRVACSEHTKQESKHAAGCGEIRFQKNTSKPRPEKPLDDIFGKTQSPAEVFASAAVSFGGLPTLLRGFEFELISEQPESQAVRERADSIEKHCEQSSEMLWRTPWVGHLHEPPAGAYQGSRGKTSQSQLFEVKLPLRLWVGCLQHLKAVVNQKSLNLIRLQSATNAGFCFQQQPGNLLFLKFAGATKSREARAYDDDRKPLHVCILMRQFYR
jgi:hypothetical protein